MKCPLRRIVETVNKPSTSLSGSFKEAFLLLETVNALSEQLRMTPEKNAGERKRITYEAMRKIRRAEKLCGIRDGKHRRKIIEKAKLKL